MSFESTDTEHFPGLYKDGSNSDPASINEEEFEKQRKKESSGKKKESKKDKKEKGYVMFEEEDSEGGADDKSPSKLKKNKAFRFSSKDIFLRKEKNEKEEKKESKEEKRDRKQREGKVYKKGKKAKKYRSGLHKGPPQPEVIDKPIFGVPLSIAVERNKSHDGIELPALFRQCIAYIEEHGLSCEGIYRISGVKSKVQNLKDSANKNIPLYLEEHEPNIVASLLKQFLRDLPEPVLSTALMPKFEEASTLKNEKKKLEAFQKLTRELPTCNRLLLSWMIVHMTHIIERKAENKMTLQNVSIVLSPTMQISHRVLNVLFLLSNQLFKDTVIKPYIPPLKPATSKWSLELPDNPAAIKEELLKQESLLNQLHEEFNASQADPLKEEQLWEVQRIVTQLKRTFKKAQEAVNKQKNDCGQKTIPPVSENEELRFELRQLPPDTSPAAQDSSQIPCSAEEKSTQKQTGDTLETAGQPPQKQTIKQLAEEAVKETTEQPPTQKQTIKQLAEEAVKKNNAAEKEDDSEPSSVVNTEDSKDFEKKTDSELSDDENLNSQLNDDSKRVSEESEAKDLNSDEENKAEANKVETNIDEINMEEINKEETNESNKAEINKTETNKPVMSDLSDTNISSLHSHEKSLEIQSASLENITNQDSSVKAEDLSVNITAQDASVKAEDLSVKSNSEPNVSQKIDESSVNPVEKTEEHLSVDSSSISAAEIITQDIADPSVESNEEYLQSFGNADDTDVLEHDMEEKLEGLEGETVVFDDDDEDSELSDTTVSSTPVAFPTDHEIGISVAQDEVTDQKVEDELPVDLDRADLEEDLEKLLDGEYALKLEEEELLAIGDELRKKIETEQSEIERLKQEIIELQYLRQDSDIDDYSSSSESEYETEDEEELQETLNKIMRENEQLERENADLTQKIHEERMHCLDVKVKIRLLQQKQHEISVYGECILDTDNPF